MLTAERKGEGVPSLAFRRSDHWTDLERGATYDEGWIQTVASSAEQALGFESRQTGVTRQINGCHVVASHE